MKVARQPDPSWGLEFSMLIPDSAEFARIFLMFLQISHRCSVEYGRNLENSNLLMKLEWDKHGKLGLL